MSAVFFLAEIVWPLPSIVFWLHHIAKEFGRAGNFYQISNTLVRLLLKEKSNPSFRRRVSFFIICSPVLVENVPTTAYVHATVFNPVRLRLLGKSYTLGSLTQ